MKPQLVEETDKHYVMHDGKAPFRVAKAGLSEKMHARIKAMAPKMAEGGAAPFFDTSDLTAPNPEAQAQLDAQLSPPNPQALAAMTSALDVPTEDPRVKQAQEALAATQANPSLREQWLGKTAAEDEAQVKAGEELAKAKKDEVLKPETAGWEKFAAERGGFAPAAPAPKANSVAAPAMSDAERLQAGFAKAGVAPVEPDKVQTTEEEASAARQRANNEITQLMVDQQRQLEASALEDKARHAKAAAWGEEALKKHQALADKLANLDASVDTGRFWASRSTPGKIAGVLGLVLGALGAGSDGVNRASGILDKAIDRDIDAQKAEYEMKLKKGMAGLDESSKMYGMHRQMAQDEDEAAKAAKISALTMAENRAKMLQQQTKNPEEQAALAKFIANLQASKAAAAQSIAEKNRDYKLKEMLDTSTAAEHYAAAAKANAEAGKVGKPGDNLPPGIISDRPVNEKQAEELTKTTQTAAELTSNLRRIKDSLNRLDQLEAKGVPNPGDYRSERAVLEKEAAGAVVKLKEAAHLRSLQENGDLPYLNDQLGDPTAMLKSKDSMRRVLDSLIKSTNHDVDIAAGSVRARKHPLLKWAEENPDDPRAPQVLEKLGVAR